ncbi:MAG: restriction endonuclease subunit S [Lachnospiraceae bacterium]|nr:restriction endonuclease subunit S [Lachnospiraceae bacterium]
MEKIKLGDLCNPSQSQIKEQPDTIIDYIDISSVDNESKTVTGYQTMTFAESPSRARKAVKKGNILVSTVRPNLNAVAILEDDTPNISVASTGFCVLDCKENTDNRFVFNYCKSKIFIDDMVSQATGASYPAVSDKIIRSAMVPAYSYDEQRKIGEVLDKISFIIEKRRMELRELDNLIKARFVELLSNTELGEETTIEKITEKVKVGFVGTCEKYYTDEYGIPMIRTGNITENGIDMIELKYVTKEFHEKNKKSQIHAGDLLIARHGSNGQANVYDGPEAQCLNAVVIVPNKELTTPVFLAGLINSPSVKAQIDKTLVGSTQHVVNTKSIAALNVRIPSLKIQREYEDFINQVDKSKIAVQKSLEETRKFFDSLMQEYFG